MKTIGMKISRWFALIAIASSAIAAIATLRTAEPAIAKSAAEERSEQIEAALFTRAEFFGAQAILPYPTAEARTRLAEVQTRYPNDAGITLKLAGLDEKLNDAGQALAGMQRYVELEKNSLAALGKLAEFHHRRARFADEAAVRERMIDAAPRAERAAILQQLIELARRHRLEKYQRPDFFRQLIASDPGAFEVVKQFIDHQIETGELAEALSAIRQYKTSFPGEPRYFLDKEVATLVKLKRGNEAEQVYVRAFDPFWSDEQSRHFYYEFLNDRDRLRAYGRELKETLRRNPADFDAAVKMFHYLHYDYEENDAAAANIFTRLEKARAARGANWTPDELATMSRLLIAGGQVDQASRFLYTLHQQGALERGGELRSKILYEIFRLLFNAGTERTPLTAGDLRFYQDVAASDPHPGMLGGVLSLVLADTNPRAEFETEEAAAIGHFNLAAAYRVFLTYKQEYPTSPEMAGMYLDLIRHYSKTSEANVAAELLTEFEKRYGDAPQYADVALALADCYVNYKKHEQERAIYQRVLDHLGERRKKDKPLVPADGSGDDLTSRAPATINAPPSEGEEEEGYSRVTRFLPVALKLRKNAEEESVSYQSVLLRYVSSLARENRTAEILALYSSEIKKYPDEQGLYEQMLAWQGQTNLVEEQLRVYQDAIKRFPSGVWTDRLARWYLRRDRKQAFETLSRELLETMNDEEVEAYFAKFVASGASNAASGFDANLYLSCYTRAHQRFPHNLKFVEGLLNYYAGHKQWDDWRRLLAEYYFESKEIRERYMSQLAGGGKLREYADAARGRDSLPYKLFRADAAVWLANYEEAVDAYRELDRLYPNTPEFAERLVALTRSFGQKDFKSLEEAARVQHAMADAAPSSESYRTTAGELYAEQGDTKSASRQWDQLLALGAGDKDVFLNAATVYWDYFQYDDALRVIRAMRKQMRDESLYAFQVAAILEAKHQTNEAVAEYVKDLDQNSDNYWRAKRRLATLYKRKGGVSAASGSERVPEILRAAFQRELNQAKDRDSLVLGYVALLRDVERKQEASALLKREIARSKSQDFLDEARDYFREMEDEAGEAATLRRLTANARTQRFAISYQLQLAEHAAGKGRKDEAASMVTQLVNRFPTNYGVLTEGADFYWRLGKRENAVALLGRASQRGRGRFHYIFARKLAARQIERGQTGAAETVLNALYKENPRNLDVFDQLTKLYVSASRPDALRERYRETIRAIKQADLDRYEIRAQVEQLRAQVIEAFTQLRDYPAAVEQHIEIINRDPDDEEAVNAAIKYAKRYGGGDTLIAYYAKTSQEAYKDYRWNLILARIYDAKSDLPSAARELRKAIDNQPEMIELHAELAEVNLKAKEYDAAVKSLNAALKLSNDDPAYLKKLAEAYDKAGRKRDADAARAKLPTEKPKAKTTRELFAEAGGARGAERAKAIETYRKAFNEFAADVYKHELSGYELNGYVEALRGEEPLDQILRRLWDVRERIKQDVGAKDNLLAGKARSLGATFDRAIPEAVGRVAAESATGNELEAIDRDVRAWVNGANGRAGGDETLVALFNLSQRAKLDRLSEEILLARKDAAFALSGDPANYHGQVTSLVNFYSERGAYSRVVELLRREEARDKSRQRPNYRPMIAEYARLVGDRENELRALRDDYAARTGKLTTNTDATIERYFESLLENGDAGRNELRQRIAENHPHRFQLISFLVRSNEMQLAREAIDRAPLPQAWKSSRQAELSVLARDLNATNGAHFLSALRLQTIGESIASKSDPTPALAQNLAGDSWFALAEGYGKWLAMSGKSKTAEAAALLPAMLENRPKDAAAQWRLGAWYLEQGDPGNAIEHLSLALELRPGDKAITADLGSAYFKLGQPQQAQEQWAKIIAGKEPAAEDYALYLRTLGKHGLADEARAKLKPFLLKHLNGDKEFDAVRPLIYAVAKSFGKTGGKARGVSEAALTPQEEAGKTAFLRELCDAASGGRLPEMVIRESLVKRDRWAPFYEMVIARNPGAPRNETDYDFAEQLRQHSAWSAEEVEESIDHQARADVRANANQSGGARLDWQRECLDYLLTRRSDADAAKLVAFVEQELKGRYPRPVWLRLARLRLDVRVGRMAEAMAGLKRFALIEASERIEEAHPPSVANLERLNDAVAMLRGEKRNAEANELSKAAYERTIAMEQYECPSFTGLSRLAFEAGDADRGVKLLGWMIALGNAATRETTAAELAALDWVKARAIEMPTPSNQIQEAEALRLAAEVAAEFGQFAFAVECRQRLTAISPGDFTNRIELARTLAALGKNDDAMAALGALMADAQATRQSRWTAVWSAAELAGKNAASWQSLTGRVNAGSKDNEMLAAIDALSQFHQGRAGDGIGSAVAAAKRSPAAPPTLLAVFLQKNAGQPRAALQTLLGSTLTASDDSLAQPFSATEDDVRWLLPRLYAAGSQPRAALKLASADERLKGRSFEGLDALDVSPEFDAERAPRLAQLSLRAAERQTQSRIELLGLLSIAAEQTGDLGRAIEFERARFDLLSNQQARRESKSRIEALLAKRNERKAPLSFAINENAVSAY